MKNASFNNVCIIGVGLIGGSIGLALKKRGLANNVIGVFRSRESLRTALQKQVVDKGFLDADIKQAIHGFTASDLIILATPVETIKEHLKLLCALKTKAVVIDVGSTKSEIDEIGNDCLGANFIGCHPMAGSEKKGFYFSKPDLFEYSVCFVTKKSKSISAFWAALGAKAVYMDGDTHDFVVSKRSHLPHVISFALLSSFSKGEFVKGLPMNPSLQPLARLAQSDASVWADILLSNRKAILQSFKDLESNLEDFLTAIQKKDSKKLSLLIQKANAQSKKLN